MATNASQSNISNSGIDYSRTLLFLSFIFLLWGSAFSANFLLIDKISKSFQLTQQQEWLLNYGVFVAYFIVSLPLAWIVNRVGYKRGLVLGLGASALGMVLYYPALGLSSVAFLIASNFVFGAGMAVLQTTANPYVAVLGTPESAAARLNRAQAYFSLGGILLPLVFVRVLFQNRITTEQILSALQLPYLIGAVVLLILAVLSYLIKLPKIGATTKEDKETEEAPSAWAFIHLILAAIGVFLVVGAEASVLFYFEKFAGENGLNALKNQDISQYITLFAGAVVVGRLLGSSIQKEGVTNHIIGGMVLWILGGFVFAKFATAGVTPLINAVADFNLDNIGAWFSHRLFEPVLFTALSGITLIGFAIGGKKAENNLIVFSVASILFLLAAVFLNTNILAGTEEVNLSLWAIIGFGFFSAVLFPNIFALGIRELGRSTSQGAAILVMAMVGGALLPLLTETVSTSAGVRMAFFVPAGALLYLTYFGIDGYKVRQYTISRGITDTAIGVDIGAATTNIGIVDRKGNVIGEDVLYTEEYKTADLLVKAIHDKIENLLQRTKQAVNVKGIGIGAPNGNIFNGTLDNPINLQYEGEIPLVHLFQKHIKLPVVLTNDANAAALGEMTYGAAHEMKDFVTITLGNYLGSGLVVNGKVVYGKDGHAGELGHVNVQPEGRLCTCGRRGCLQTYVSAHGLIRTVQTILGDTIEKSQLRDVKPDDLTGKMIYAAANQGDKVAIQAFTETGKILGRKLADVVAHTSPEAIFLTGGMAKAGEILMEPAREELRANILSIYDSEIPVVSSELNGNATVLGAAALIWETIDQQIEA